MSNKFENNKFSVMAGGKEIVCDILFKFHSQETGKDYMAFTDHTKGRDGNVNVFYATYDPEAEDISLAPIETEQEWTMVREIFQTMQDDATRTLMEQLREAMGAPAEENGEEKPE